MQQRPSFTYGGLAAIMVQFLIILATAQATHFNWLGPDPISNLGLTTRACLYGLAFAVGATCLALFAAAFRHTYRLGRTFSRTFGVGIAAELVTGLVPDQPAALQPLGVLWPLHWLAAAALIVAIPAVMLVVARARQLAPHLRQLSGLLCAIYLSLLGPELYLMATHTLYALSEATSLLLFDVWIIVLTFALMGDTTPTETKLPLKHV